MYKVSIIGICVCFCCINIYANPIEGKINKEGINVRTDSTTYALSIGSMHKGEDVRILNKRFSWYKVILPPEFVCYVYSNYVSKAGPGSVEVKANILNLRSKPSLDAPIVGKVKKGDILSTVNSELLLNKIDKNKWIKVVGFPYAYGWVHSKFINIITAKNGDKNPVKPNNNTKSKVVSKSRSKKKKNSASSFKINYKTSSKLSGNKYNYFKIKGLLYKLYPLKDCPANYKIKSAAMLSFIRVPEVDNVNSFVKKNVIVTGGKVRSKGCSYIYVDKITLSK